MGKPDNRIRTAVGSESGGGVAGRKTVAGLDAERRKALADYSGRGSKLGATFDLPTIGS